MADALASFFFRGISGQESEETIFFFIDETNAPPERKSWDGRAKDGRARDGSINLCATPSRKKVSSTYQTCAVLQGKSTTRGEKRKGSIPFEALEAHHLTEHYGDQCRTQRSMPGFSLSSPSLPHRHHRGGSMIYGTGRKSFMQSIILFTLISCSGSSV